LRLLDHCDPRHQERPAPQELQDPEAGLALHNQMMRTVLPRDVAHDRSRRSDPVKVRGRDVRFLRIALEQESRPQLALDRFLGRRDRTRTADRHR